MSAALTEGTALFARYADAPNALGYCGPTGGDRHHRGRRSAASARRFSGAWPYLQVLARLTGAPTRSTPGSSRRTGWAATSASTAQEFGRELLAVHRAAGGRATGRT